MAISAESLVLKMQNPTGLGSGHIWQGQRRTVRRGSDLLQSLRPSQREMPIFPNGEALSNVNLLPVGLDPRGTMLANHVAAAI
ncbi:hypothetical protein, partial [Aureimonas endophytica]|uniref:hypothetical protein n=1 Tax=Aureimonas endophytica TaxID=2027858 RepID=UPI001AED68CA